MSAFFTLYTYCQTLARTLSRTHLQAHCTRAHTHAHIHTLCACVCERLCVSEIVCLCACVWTCVFRSLFLSLPCTWTNGEDTPQKVVLQVSGRKRQKEIIGWRKLDCATLSSARQAISSPKIARANRKITGVEFMRICKFRKNVCKSNYMEIESDICKSNRFNIHMVNICNYF